MNTITLPVELDLDHLAFTLAREVSNDDLIKLIKAIDDNVCEYEFTEELLKMFQGVIDKENGV